MKEIKNKLFTILMNGDPGAEEEFFKALSNFNWLNAGHFLRLLLCFVTGIFIARHLGPTNFGVYSFVVSYCMLFTPFLAISETDVVVAELSSPVNKDKLIANTLVLKFAAIWVMIISALLMAIIQGFAKEMIFFTSIFLGAMFFRVYDIFEAYLFSLNKHLDAARVKIFALLVYVSLRFYFVWLGVGVDHFLLAILLEHLIIFVGLGYIFLKNMGSFKFSFDWLIIKKLIKRSWPLLLSAAASLIYYRIDQVMIRAILGYKSVGLYSVAVHVGEALNFVPISICMVLLPALLASKKKDQMLYEARLQKLFSFLTLTSVMLSILAVVFAPSLMLKLFGEKYLLSTTSLKILVWALVPVSWCALSGKWLVVEKKEHFLFKIHFIGAFVNIVMNLFSISLFGIAGAAWSTLITWIVVAIVIDVFFRDLRNLLKMKLRSLLGKGLLK